MADDPAFQRLEPSARAHFRLCFFSAVLRLVAHLRATSPTDDQGWLHALLERFPFLNGYFVDLRQFVPEGVTWDSVGDWWEGEIRRWERAADVHLPLAALSRHDIDSRACLALLLAGLVEEDSRFGEVFASIQGGERRPTIETIGHVLPFDDGADGWATCRPLVASGLLTVANEQAPRLEWVVRVPVALWDAAHGTSESQPLSWCRWRSRDDLPDLDTLVVDERFRAHLRRVAPLVRRDGASVVVVRGTPGSDRLLVLQAVARALDCGTLEMVAGAAADPAWHLAGPLCALTHALPIIIWDAAPGETLDLPPLGGYRGPVAIAMGLEGGLGGWAAEHAVTLTVPHPSPGERLRVWQAALGGCAVPDLTLVSERFQLPGAYIRQAASGAIAHAALDGREAIGMDDVRSACRLLNRQLLDTLAARLDADGAWTQLVVSDGTATKLRELERRCRHRERLLDRVGWAVPSNNRGVRALFTGPSGTGKTLAAKILAGPSVLGMDLYRVDLAAIVNKYIGETEKNLHRILTRAEELDVVLLLDEGDALLGRRTEVKSANDRYANLETNYLLQRLETYQGIVIVTTNAGENIDPAFQRRMDVVVEFVPPQAQERWRIWRLHLPPDQAVDDPFLEEIAQRCALSGGQIRNAALHAALLALDERSVVRRWHVAHAVDSEYRKAGATSPLRDVSRPASDESSMRAFINALSV